MRLPSRVRLVITVVVISYTALLGIAYADPPVGFTETWSGTSTQNWGGGSSVTNPGSGGGGAGGAGDGYLLVATPGVGHLGARSNGAPYVGDWRSAGIEFVRFSINDVGTDEPLEIHFAIGNGSNFWQSNVAISPPENAWGEVTIDLTAADNFTQILGTGTFDAALHNVDRIHFRHDLAPFAQTPDSIQGDFGIDNLLLGGPMTPTFSTSWGRIKAQYR
jgi:hypothetical protein